MTTALVLLVVTPLHQQDYIHILLWLLATTYYNDGYSY